MWRYVPEMRVPIRVGARRFRLGFEEQIERRDLGWFSPLGSTCWGHLASLWMAACAADSWRCRLLVVRALVWPFEELTRVHMPGFDVLRLTEPLEWITLFIALDINTTDLLTTIEHAFREVMPRPGLSALLVVRYLVHSDLCFVLSWVCSILDRCLNEGES